MLAITKLDKSYIPKNTLVMIKRINSTSKFYPYEVIPYYPIHYNDVFISYNIQELNFNLSNDYKLLLMIDSL